MATGRGPALGQTIRFGYEGLGSLQLAKDQMGHMTILTAASGTLTPSASIYGNWQGWRGRWGGAPRGRLLFA